MLIAMVTARGEQRGTRVSCTVPHGTVARKEATSVGDPNKRVRMRVCPYKTTSIEVSKFPSGRSNQLVIQLRFLS
jgi:hypothetical protein